MNECTTTDESELIYVDAKINKINVSKHQLF